MWIPESLVCLGGILNFQGHIMLRIFQAYCIHTVSYLARPPSVQTIAFESHLLSE